jgi:hypothetical protein
VGKLADLVVGSFPPTDSVILPVSCGKDSVAALTECRSRFRVIRSFFLYLVPDLSFQENYLKYIERKFQIEIVRFPHWQLSHMLKNSTFMPFSRSNFETNLVEMNDIENHFRKEFGYDWMVYGQKCSDSIERNAMLKKIDGIDFKTKRFYPLARKNDAWVYNVLKKNKIMLSAEYQMFGHSFGSLGKTELRAIKSRFPEDFKKILEVFPYAAAAVV